MKFKLVLIALLTTSVVFAGPLDPKFFANRAFQNQFPGAFVLQEESHEFLHQSLALTVRAGDLLIQAIQRTPGLAASVSRFPSLSPAERIHVMQQIFRLQTAASGARAPELILDKDAVRSAFFDFDPDQPTAGRVILNPLKLFQDANPYAALLLLIHETRHSQQFQTAFKPNPLSHRPSTQAYGAAFTAQKQIFDRSLQASFCDFLTLNNEYEAFLFGNYVMEKLTMGAVETGDMGTWASQYTLEHGLRIHLPNLARRVGPGKLLDAFNILEMTQYQEVEP